MTVKYQQKVVDLLDHYYSVNDKVNFGKYFQKLQKTNAIYNNYSDKFMVLKTSSFVVHIQYNPKEQIIF